LAISFKKEYYFVGLWKSIENEGETCGNNYFVISNKYRLGANRKDISLPVIFS